MSHQQEAQLWWSPGKGTGTLFLFFWIHTIGVMIQNLINHSTLQYLPISIRQKSSQCWIQRGMQTCQLSLIPPTLPWKILLKLQGPSHEFPIPSAPSGDFALAATSAQMSPLLTLPHLLGACAQATLPEIPTSFTLILHLPFPV